VTAETPILLTIHEASGPWLDRFFLLSHYLGTLWFCAPFVLALISWHRARGEGPTANVWLGVGLSTYLLQEGLKRLLERPRPQLWPRLETWPPVAGSESFAFPSGHALASATFYPLLAYVLTRRRSAPVRRAALATGVLVALWIGFGRLYLGVHWPTDVLAGWALGAGQAVLAARFVADAPAAPAPS
jgi:undecaprenyl-diphosphatase